MHNIYYIDYYNMAQRVAVFFNICVCALFYGPDCV